MKGLQEALPEGCRRIYLCEDSPEGIFTAVYDAWAEGLPLNRVELRVETEETFSLFSQYVRVETDPEKARKVARSVSRKISREAYDLMFQGALSEKPEKADLIYRFLKIGFRVGSGVTGMFGEPCVWSLFELARHVGHEAHLFTGFVRFSSHESGILVGKIRPKNQILPLIAPHFADRFPRENWAIIDERREQGIFHRTGSGWIIAPVDREGLREVWEGHQEDPYEDLWRTFFRSIAIKERHNPKCQRNLCALRYRDYMIEFDSEGRKET